MKIFEVEFVYDNYDKREAADVGSRKNPFRVRIPFPIKESYHPTYWSVNHRKIEREFENKYNPHTHATAITIAIINDIFFLLVVLLIFFSFYFFRLSISPFMKLIGFSNL